VPAPNAEPENEKYSKKSPLHGVALLNTKNPSAASGFALGRNQTSKIGSCGSGELFFASAFLFTASAFGEGGEKQKPKSSFLKKTA